MKLQLTGNESLDLVLWRTISLSGTFALATLVGRVFKPTLHVKGHLLFGQILSLSFQCLYYGRGIGTSIDSCKDPLKKEFLSLTHFIAICLLPMFLARGIVNRWVEQISWRQSGRRALYFASFACAAFYCKRRVTGSF